MAFLRDLTASRARLVLTGPDRVRFLHGMVTNDIEALQPGQGCHAAMLTPKGKMQATLVVYADADRLLLETDRTIGQKVHDVLFKHIIMDDVELTDLTNELKEVGVFGNDAADAVEGAVGVRVADLAPYAHVTAGSVRIARAPELGVPGYHVFGPVAIEGTLLDDAAWEVMRVEAGTPRYGADLGEDRLPIEANLTDAVSFTKGCYLGQEVIARATNLGHINKRLVGLRLDGDGPAEAGAKLSAPSRADAGAITSSVVSPRFGAIALAYVHRTLWDPGTELTLAADPPRRAVVAALPFTG